MEIWRFVLLFFWLSVLAFLDMRWKRVPIWLLAVGGIFVTIMSVIESTQGMRRGTELIWALLPGVIFLLMAVTTKKAGLADGVVLLLLGLTLNYQECAASFVLSLFAMSLVSLALLVLRRVRRNSKLPYLPFLWVGYMAQAMIGFGG